MTIRNTSTSESFFWGGEGGRLQEIGKFCRNLFVILNGTFLSRIIGHTQLSPGLHL